MIPVHRLHRNMELLLSLKSPSLLSLNKRSALSLASNINNRHWSSYSRTCSFLDVPMPKTCANQALKSLTIFQGTG